MSYKIYDIDNTSVQMVMVIKLNQLKKNGLPALTYAQFEEYIMSNIWNERVPTSLNEATNHIMHITTSDIINYLSKQAVIEGANAHIEDFKDIIGG